MSDVDRSDSAAKSLNSHSRSKEFVFFQNVFDESAAVEAVGLPSAGDRQHLLLGVTKEMLVAFLRYIKAFERNDDSSPPDWYDVAFPTADEGEVRAFFTGYEVCDHVRHFMTQSSWSSLSAVEVLMSQNAPGVAAAQVFLSHSQGEPISVTARGMGDAAFMLAIEDMTFFVDYACIRQCVEHDFRPAVVEDIVGEIGHTCLLLSPSKAPWSLQRAWCVYEISCTISTHAQLTALPALSTQENLEWDAACPHWEEPLLVKLEECKARKERDRAWIVETIERTTGLQRANEIVSEATRSGVKNFIEWRNGLDEEAREAFVYQRSCSLAELQRGLGVATDVISIGRAATEFGFTVALLGTKFGFDIARGAIRVVGMIPGLGIIMGAIDKIVGAAQKVTEGSQSMAGGIVLGSIDVKLAGLSAAGAIIERSSFRCML